MQSSITIRQTLALLAICLVTMVPGIWSLPPLDRDESRYLQSTKQMLETGDYFDIRLQEAPRYKKPIGIYWLQAGAVRVTGYGEEAPVVFYRLVSIAGGILAAIATMWLAAGMFGASAGLLAGIAMATMVGLIFEARVAKTDAALLATVVLSQLFLARLYLKQSEGVGSERKAAFAFWFFQGLGILLKGPVVVLASGLTAITLLIFDRNRDWIRSLRFGWGLAIIALINLPWLVWISWKSGAAFWQEAIGRDLFGKVVSGQESHGFPPGYYFLTYSLFVWPFGYLALRAGLSLLNRFSVDAAARFLFCWYVPFWILFELIPTKLPHYLLPAYPALAIALGWHLSDTNDAGPEKRWQVWFLRLAMMGQVIVTLGLALAPSVLQLETGSGITFAGILTGTFILIASYIAFPPGDRIRPLTRITSIAIASACAYALLTMSVLPGIERIWISRNIAEIVETQKPCTDSRLVITGFYEPSLVFAAGTNTQLTNIDGVIRQITTGDRCTVVAFPANTLAVIRSKTGGSMDALKLAGQVDGLNYSNGRRVNLVIYAGN